MHAGSFYIIECGVSLNSLKDKGSPSVGSWQFQGMLHPGMYVGGDEEGRREGGKEGGREREEGQGEVDDERKWNNKEQRSKGFTKYLC